MHVPKTVLLDMDGVIVDFVKGALKAHQKENPWLSKPSLCGSYDMHDIWGISISEFWEKIVDTENFWSNLDKTPEADSLLELLNQLHLDKKIKLFLCSSPSHDPFSHYGKAQWVKNNCPDLINRLILTNHKHLLAKQNTLLIDDSNRNVSAFLEHRGNAILFPRPWNSKYTFRDDPMKFFKMELHRFVR